MNKAPWVWRADPKASEVTEAVRRGFETSPRSLPPWLFYDDAGTAIFDRITEIPEYDVTRAEREILETHGDAIAEAAGEGPIEVVELGAGLAQKTQVLLRALVRRQGRVLYVPIDVSTAALDGAVARLAREEPAVVVKPLAGSHLRALSAVPVSRQRLVLFLGSSLGNYGDDEAVALLSAVAAVVAPGGALLLGTDRRREPAVHLPGYDDPAGVTASFNLNLLVRLNRELGADFDLDRWRHVALWNEAVSCVEMHLESIGAQDVFVAALGGSYAFADGERIHTESSVKYDEARVARILRASGWAVERRFTDEGASFDLWLARR